MKVCMYALVSRHEDADDQQKKMNKTILRWNLERHFFPFVPSPLTSLPTTQEQEENTRPHDPGSNTRHKQLSRIFQELFSFFDWGRLGASSTT